MGDGSQSGASTTSQNEGFHVYKPRGIIWSGMTVSLFCHLKSAVK